MGPRCELPVTLRLANPPDSAITVGRVASMVGRVTVTASGVRVDAARTTDRVASAHQPSAAVSLADNAWGALLRWRARLGDIIDENFRSRAPLVRALLIADQQGIAPELRDRYADAGLVHMLSVSGMHVAIIASALLTLGGLLRVPRRWIEPMAMLLVAFYVILLGCPPPAVRSAVMLLVVSLSRQWQRPVHEWTALALGAAIPTANPLVVLDLGWQLSVGGMAALVATRSLLRQWRLAAASARSSASSGSRWRRLGAQRGAGGWLMREIVTGVLATLLTAPIIAWTFGRVSLIAPVSNILAAPIVALLQPALFLALLWAMVVSPPRADLLADATQPLMALFDLLASWCGSLPGAVWPVSLTLASALGAGIAVAFFVRGTATRRSAPWLLMSAAAGVVALWWPLTQRGSGQLELHAIDVGQGDALAIRTPRGRWVLVDAGRRWDGGDAGRRTIVPYVRRLGGDVALFVLSHPHDDHAGGAATIVEALRPTLWWEPAFVSASAGYRAALDAIRQAHTRWERVRPGRRFDLDQVAFEVLAPDSAWTVAQHDANETSLVLRVTYGQHRMLLTGDAERQEEAWLLERYDADDLAADVLKLGHHGSRTSSTPALLDAVNPRVAIASVGAGNRYGHPAAETLANLLARDVPALRTDLEGTVVIRSDGHTLTAEAGSDRWIIPARRRVQ
ncbi:ComEC/Rec2 family competence protein [Gemmatimonas sp.]